MSSPALDPEPTPSYIRKAEFVEGHDGDSFWLRLDHGKYPLTRSEDTIYVRLRDIYCPELKDPNGGPAAEAFTTSTLAGAQRITVRSLKPSFARTVADVWVDGQPLAKLIADAGHGELAR